MARDKLLRTRYAVGSWLDVSMDAVMAVEVEGIAANWTPLRADPVRPDGGFPMFDEERKAGADAILELARRIATELSAESGRVIRVIG